MRVGGKVYRGTTEHRPGQSLYSICFLHRPASVPAFGDYDWGPFRSTRAGNLLRDGFRDGARYS